MNSDNGLAAFQRENCSDCNFADKLKVGTGEPCCQYPGKLDHRNRKGQRPTGDDELLCWSKKVSTIH